MDESFLTLSHCSRISTLTEIEGQMKPPFPPLLNAPSSSFPRPFRDFCPSPPRKITGNEVRGGLSTALAHRRIHRRSRYLRSRAATIVTQIERAARWALEACRFPSSVNNPTVVPVGAPAGKRSSTVDVHRRLCASSASAVDSESTISQRCRPRARLPNVGAFSLSSTRASASLISQRATRTMITQEPCTRGNPCCTVPQRGLKGALSAG